MALFKCFFNISVMVFVICCFSLKTNANPTVDSFIKKNPCFFWEAGFFDFGDQKFEFIFESHSLESSSNESPYRTYFWEDQCKIFNEEKSTYKEDIVEFSNVENTNCKKTSLLKKLFSKKKQVKVYHYNEYNNADNTYCRYVFKYRDRYINIVFKLRQGKLIRFCYHLMMS